MKTTSGLLRTIQPGITLQLPIMLALLMTATLAFADEHGMHGDSGNNDIVETASKAGNFETLLTAAKAAGLVETLKGTGPYTLFAPTDEAFARIPADQLNALLKDKPALTKVLTNHLIRGEMTADKVVKLASAMTVAGQSVTINTDYGVRINNAKVIKTDIMASNGIIHVIDTVIMPD